MLTTMVLAALAALAEPPVATLPIVWHGRWKGTLEIAPPPQASGRAAPSADPVKLAVELDIAPLPEAGSWSWTIIYGEGDTRQVRPYVLRGADRVGTFLLDEKNGIVLDERLVGDVLTGAFEVQGNLLVSRYECHGDELRLEIVTFATKDPRVSRVGPADQQSSVTSYPPSAHQSAVLKRVKATK